MSENSLSKEIEQIIKNNNFLEDWLYNWYINITGLALYIIPFLKKKINKEISLDSVKMAISRINKKIDLPEKEAPINVKDIYIKNDICLTFFENNDFNEEKIIQIKKPKHKYISKTYANKEISIVFEKELSDYVNKIIPLKKSKLFLEDLILIWINISNKDNLYNPWLIYNLTKKFYFYKINILKFFQTTNEVSFVIDKKDLTNAINAIITN